MSKAYFNEKLRAWRLSKKITQRKLADRLDVGIVTICRWEAGIQRPSKLALYRLQTLGFFHSPDESVPHELLK